MATIKPFKGLRPPKELVEQVQSRPYDVLDSQEAKEEAAGNEKSLYRIIKPEINFSPILNEYDEKVYEKAHEMFSVFKNKGWLVKGTKECYYLYAQTMNDKTQYGFVVCANVHDYVNGVIKKHELTRREKEDDRMRHVRSTNANMEPVFLAYPDNQTLAAIEKKYTQLSPEYDFIAPIDGFRHRFWIINDDKDINTITQTFSEIPHLYIADGHHRSAAAARVGLEKAASHPNCNGTEEYNYFMAVCFPSSQLTILDYNRVVKDLNGLSPEEFLKALSEDFDIEPLQEKEDKHPQKAHQFSLYLQSGQWYLLTAKPSTFDPTNPIGNLDVDISSRLILDKILGIKDLRSDKRIDFVGGLRGLEELERRVNSGEMAMALALYPVSMEQIMDIANHDMIMPPKATWFEPKLRSGLVVHELED